MPNASHPGAGTPRTVLHIGAMKTGTTFLQQLLADHRDALEAHGYQVPRKQAAGLRAVLAGASRPGRTGRRAVAAQRFLGAVRQPGGVSLVSWEFLSFLDQSQARRLLDDIGADVETVVLTVRDAARTLPAQWQTRCRNGTTLPWPRFTAAVGAWLDSGRPSAAARVFERTQGVPRMLDAWTGAVGADRLRVVTVPQPGGDPLLLWRRFAEAVGADPFLITRADVRRNPSLGHPSCELLRRLNKAVGPDVPEHYAAVVRAVVAPDLEARAATEPRVRPDGPGLAVAASWNRRSVDAIRAAGVRVVGDLDTDVPTGPAAEPEPVPPPTDEQLLDAAATVRSSLAGLGATPAAERPADVASAVRELASMVRQTAGTDLDAPRRARGRGRR